MKELKKKKKKTEVFERMNVNAFHENGTNYSRGGYYDQGRGSSGPTRDYYLENDLLADGDDTLF